MSRAPRTLEGPLSSASLIVKAGASSSTKVPPLNNRKKKGEIERERERERERKRDKIGRASCRERV